MPINSTRPIVLASNSPRRRQLLADIGFTFVVSSKNVDETPPPGMAADQVPQHLACRKAEAFRDELADQVIVAADTVVIIDDRILNKPRSEAEALQMLRSLSGRTHLVVTGVCILSREHTDAYADTTEVTFRPLTDEEINRYIAQYQPFDKAGAYGVQEWLGMVAIEKLVGSYFNVMGLPVHKVYQSLAAYSQSG